MIWSRTVLLPGVLALLALKAHAGNPSSSTAVLKGGAGTDVDEALRKAEALAIAAEKEHGGHGLELARSLEALAEPMADLEEPRAQAFAEAQWRRALELRDAAPATDPEGQMALLDHLASHYETEGRWEEIEPIDRRILELRLAALGPNHPEVADKRGNLALSLYQLGRYAEGEALLVEAVRVLETAEPPQPLLLAYALNYLAENLRAQDRYREAEPLFERSLRVGEESLGPSSPDLIHLLRNMSGLYRDTQRYAEAQHLAERAFAIAEAAAEPDGPLLAGLLNNLAELRRFQGDLAGAEGLYLKAVAIAREALAPDHPRLGTFLNQVGVLYAEEGRLSEAEGLYREALAIKVKAYGPDHPDVAYTQQDLGRFYAAAGNFEEAEAAYRRACDIREQRLGPSHPDVAVSLVSLAELLGARAERRVEAAALLERAIAILEASPAEPRSLVHARLLRAETWRSEGRREEARQELARGLATVEKLRPEAGGGERTRARFLSTYAEAFHRMITWQVEDGRIEEAFRYAEKARARVLLDQLAAGRVDLRNGIEPEERGRLERREAAIKGRLAECRDRLRRLGERDPGGPDVAEATRLAAEQRAASDEFARLYEQIRNASRLWRGRAGTSDVPTLAAAQGVLRSRRALMLAYAVGAETSYVFVVPPRGRAAQVRRIEIPAEAAIALNVSAGPLTAVALARIIGDGVGAGGMGVVERLSTPPAGTRRQLGVARRLHALFRILIPSDLWPRIRKCDEVVVVPDGQLHQVPFEALVVAPAQPDRPPAYWLDAGPVVRYAASAAALVELGRAVVGDAPRAVELLSVSDPVYDPAEVARLMGVSQPEDRPSSAALERLPGTAAESEAVRRAFVAPGRASQVVSLARLEAREPAVRAALPASRYVHLATHGVVDETGADLFASLALTPPASHPQPQDDGQLELHEVYDLGLRAELVVLSACESRVGTVVAGEGVFALSRGFLAAGARRVVASLWPAADEATAQLMGAFFRAIAASEAKGRHPDFTAALAQAKRSIRKRPQWADPFFWAPFVLEGAS